MSKIFDELPDCLTVEEAAKVLRIGRNLAYEAVQTGEIPSIKIGRRIIVPKRALANMLMSNGLQTAKAQE